MSKDRKIEKQSYYLKNKRKIIERNIRWRKNNREKVNSAYRKWYQKKYWLDGVRPKNPSVFKKGHIMSKEIKTKISRTLKEMKRPKDFGKKSGETRKGKPIYSLRGENNYNWKGGITPINLKFRASLEYKLWRESVFKRDNWTCVFCKKRGEKINADHIKPFADYPELRLAIDNGRTLCVECHKKTDTFGRRRKK